MASYLVDLAGDFGAFLLALLTTWANLYTGGIIVALVTLYYAIRKKTPTHTTYIVTAIIFLVLACFNTWRVTRPGLHLHIDEVGVEEKVTDLNGGPVPAGTPVVLIASIWNLGNPSIADSWIVSIAIPGKKEINPAIVDVKDFNPNMTASYTFGKETIPLTKLLFRQTLTPIITGDKKQGILLAFVDGLKQSEVYMKGTTIKLSCRDVSGNPISATYTLKGTNMRQLHFPGLE